MKALMYNDIILLCFSSTTSDEKIREYIEKKINDGDWECLMPLKLEEISSCKVSLIQYDKESYGDSVNPEIHINGDDDYKIFEIVEKELISL